MAFKLLDRARMAVSGAPGTGNIALGAAVTGYQSFSQAGISNGDSFPYALVDGTNWEYGVATYASSGNQLTRVVTWTSAQNITPLNLSSHTVISSVLRAEDVTGLHAGAVQRANLDTTTTGSAVIAKVIAGTGVSLSSTGVDAGTGDVTVSITGGPLTTTAKIGDTSPAHAGGSGGLAYSGSAACVLEWTGAVWVPVIAAPPFIGVVVAAFANGDSVFVDCGSITDGGSQTSFGTLVGNVLLRLDLGTVP